ncbi:PREDICTED: protein IQ-DOMAIN 1-like isoform X2 [Ipomoea nil]|uniref:protein IQ-DOMAIN 1-like isoform X2 n=1 Tax=Ipomoea nil TaxID=35883 RepID=UPI000901383A|nr:PREDICTED: protein IQ-DOMAIN 1-like isoform X2 [Ipomoea nil]
MGKKGSWFSAVKKVWSSDNKKKDKFDQEAQSRGVETENTESLDDSPKGETALLNPLPETMTTTTGADDDDEQSRHAYSVAFATAIAAEAAVAAAKAAVEVARLTSVARSSRISMEEMAAIKIQSVFRGYLARRAHQGQRKLVRLKSMISERSVKQQAMTTLKCMQNIAKLQAEVRARRNRLSEENRTLHRQQQQKPEKELEKSKTLPPGGKFDVSTHTKEQIKAKNDSRQEAAKRRERALSYAHTHQMMRRGSLKSTTNQKVMDPNNPEWGWSWLERWMAARPWDDRIAVMKELSSNNDTAPVKTAPKVNARSSNKELRDDPLPVKATPKVNANSANKEPLPVKTAPKVNDTKSSATPNMQRCPPATQQLPLNTATTLPAAARLTVEVIPKGSHENDDPRSKTIVNLSSKGSHENDDPRSKISVNLSSMGSHENDDPRSKIIVNLSSKGSHENDDPRSKISVNLSSMGSHENDDPRSKTIVNLSSKGIHENDDSRSITSVNLSSKGSHENDDPRSKIIVNLGSMESLENYDPRSKTIVNLSSKESHENDDPRSKTSVNLSSKGSHENEDSRNNPSENSENSRRHSSVEAIERECDHTPNARPQVIGNPTFMAPMETTKARPRMAAPLLVLEKRHGTLEKGGSAKKKLSSHGSTRRHSAPPALI